MSWDYPMLSGGLELLLGSEKGNSAFAVTDAHPGLALQAVLVLEGIAPPGLELSRFLPPTPLVITLDEKLREMKERPIRLKDGPAWQLAASTPEQQQRLRDMLAEIRRLAEARAPAIVEQARSAMRAALGQELDRLRRLKKVNDHVRADELEALAERMAQLDAHMAEAGLRLDAVLLIAGT